MLNWNRVDEIALGTWLGSGRASANVDSLFSLIGMVLFGVLLVPGVLLGAIAFLAHYVVGVAGSYVVVIAIVAGVIAFSTWVRRECGGMIANVVVAGAIVGLMEVTVPFIAILLLFSVQHPKALLGPGSSHAQHIHSTGDRR